MGDTIASVPKRSASLVAPSWRRAARAPRRAPPPAGTGGSRSHDEGEYDLERFDVDIHTFAPADLTRHARAAPASPRCRIRGEELLANAWGWGLRTVESSAEPDTVPFGWRNFAFRSYIALQKVDTRVLEPHLPAELFYNLLVSARKPV